MNRKKHKIVIALLATVLLLFETGVVYAAPPGEKKIQENESSVQKENDIPEEEQVEQEKEDTSGEGSGEQNEDTTSDEKNSEQEEDDVSEEENNGQEDDASEEENNEQDESDTPEDSEKPDPPVYGSIHSPKFKKAVIRPGIDVSKWNGDINWKKVAKTQDFAFIRVAGRYSGSGEL